MSLVYKPKTWTNLYTKILQVSLAISLEKQLISHCSYCIKATQEGKGSTQTLQAQQQASCWPWLLSTKHVLLEYRSYLQRLIRHWQLSTISDLLGWDLGISPPIYVEQVMRLRLCINCWPISWSVASNFLFFGNCFCSFPKLHYFLFAFVKPNLWSGPVPAKIVSLKSGGS